jgi:K+-sensing histidine kinase KdpD
MNEPQSLHPAGQDGSLASLQKELETAMQTIEQLQEIRKSMHLFWHIMFNYEVGTPLSNILVCSDFLLNDGDASSFTEEQIRLLTMIRKGAQAINRTRERAVALIGFDADIAGFCDDLRLDYIDLKNVILDIGEFPEADVQIDLPDNLPKVKVSSSTFSYILTNTILALRRMGQKSKIAVNVSYADGQVIVRVTNVDFVVSEYKLEEFARAEQMPTVFGNGYLADCRCLVSWQGGEMHLDAQGENGTTITFTLPVSE